MLLPAAVLQPQLLTTKKFPQVETLFSVCHALLGDFDWSLPLAVIFDLNASTLEALLMGYWIIHRENVRLVWLTDPT